MATALVQVAGGSIPASHIVSEYKVRVPRSNKKKFNVMRFTTSTAIDVSKFGQASIRMERENNMRERGQDEETPKFGAGSEFGREQREEARKKRYSSNKNYKSEDQPWVLRIGGKTGRKYRGIRGGGITENASYYVFMKAPDGVFEAFPVEEWYNFTPIQRYKALSAEEAEEQFGRREKVMNYFSIMWKKRYLDDKGGEPAEGEENAIEKKAKKKGSKSELKLTDMDEWLSDSDNESNEDGEKSDNDNKQDKNAKDKKGKGKKKGKKTKKKKDSDEEAIEESDEGDFDDREVDYMSDSSTCSEDAAEEKMNKQLKGVEDEVALIKLNMSDDEEEEQTEKPAEGEKKEGAAGEETTNTEEKKPETKPVKPKVDKKGSSGDSSAETSDSDFDDSKFQSAMFMQKARKRGSDSAGSSRANTPTRPNGSKSSKRKQMLTPDGGIPTMGAPASKKIKHEASNTPSSTGSPSEGISEEAVRRYLMRKPMTTTELLQKFKSKRIGISGDQLVTTIAQILKKLNPEKQTIKGKLYLSIKA